MKTKFLGKHLVTFLVSFASSASFAANAKDDAPRLERWVHTSVRYEFSLSKETPVSDDGKYRLKAVRSNGEVELLELSDPKNPQPVIAKPRPSRPKDGERLPTLWVYAFDAKKQSATLYELRFK